MIPALMIGLREGLEAALVIGILVAYINKLGRRDLLVKLWLGVGSAILLSLALGFILTFGTYGLTFQAQEAIGGLMSILAVAMVTWMIFWMQKTARNMKATLQREVDEAAGNRRGWGIVAIGFVSVAREGIETTLFLWSLVKSFENAPGAIFGAVIGILAAAAIGWLLYRGMVRINLSTFFNWTGGLLVIVAAGVLAYGIGDLQEANFLPGPFSGAPITPVDAATGAVLVGFAAFPFGYAFEIYDLVPPDGFLAAFFKGTIGLEPRMSWLQVTAWAAYLILIGWLFLRQIRRRSKGRATPEPPASAPVTTDEPTPIPSKEHS